MKAERFFEHGQACANTVRHVQSFVHATWDWTTAIGGIQVCVTWGRRPKNKPLILRGTRTLGGRLRQHSIDRFAPRC